MTRMLLLTFSILFLVLAGLPWERLFSYEVATNQVLRLRVTFVAIGFSVGFGYVIATYLNKAA